MLGILGDGFRRPNLVADYISSPAVGSDGEAFFSLDDESCVGRRSSGLHLATPSSRSSYSYHEHLLTPDTPDPQRCDLKLITGDVGAIMFDFDGTLTASPGDSAIRCKKQVELRERAPLLAPRLHALREAGYVLGIISKSSEYTIHNALCEAGLADHFDGPVVPKAVGLEGKAGFIDDIVRKRLLNWRGPDEVSRVMLVDDDVRELDRARLMGIQTYAAPPIGGLQDEDFDEIFRCLGLQVARSISPFKRSPTRHGSMSRMSRTMSANADCGRGRLSSREISNTNSGTSSHPCSNVVPPLPPSRESMRRMSELP
jgi:FMN phosphatase YigB (HAD superfamily)